MSLMPANGQQVSEIKPLPNVAVGIGVTRIDSTRKEAANVGLTGQTDTLRGFQLNLLASAVKNEMRGVQLGGLMALSGGNAYGVQLSAMNSVGNSVRGVQLSGITSLARSINGLQLSGINNISLSPFRGIQVAAITNISMGVKRGIQMAAVGNISSSYMRGLQIGTYNYADTLNGSQIGLFNVAIRHPRGWQVGLVNYTRDTVAHKIGLVNVNPNTRMDFMAYYGTSSKLNLAFRFRNRSTYNIVGLGTHYYGFDNDFSGTLFYRIGQYFMLSPRWSISGDVGYYHIENIAKNSESKPDRLYSLQAHLNADYQISRTLGAFASVGYGTTRYYAHDREYRHGLIGQIGLTFRYNRPVHDAVSDRYAGLLLPPDTTKSIFAYDTREYQKKRPWTAAAEAVGINVLVHCFDRFVLNAEFAEVNMHTIHKNFKTGFVWDNDFFSTNLFSHPYHGNLYFNSARSNGLSFWEAAPYSFGGSLMWEFLGENEPAAINDLLATTFGGICLGEVTHRVSELLLDDRTHGFSRFLREFAATVINPIGGFNRIIKGQAWRIRHKNYLYHDYKRIPVSVLMSIGWRYLADEAILFRGEHQPYLNFSLEYGDAVSTDENQPYDYFAASLSAGFTGNQPLIHGVHILGRLWSAPIHTGQNVETEFGVFHHFNYYDSEPVKDGSKRTPYRISEAAAFGPGMIYRFSSVGVLSRLEQRVFIDGIILGGTKSDYYNVLNRDYNMGSGYSLKANTIMQFRNLGSFTFFADYYHLYTWKGYEGKDLEHINPLYLNAQGDKGNAELLVLNTVFRLRLKDALHIDLSGSYYIRNTHYTYHPDVTANTFEVRLGLSVGL